MTLKHSQKTLIHDWLSEREWAGVHSLEIRRAGYSGNPSERIRELAADGVALKKRREKLDKTAGVRYWLARYAPRNSEVVPFDEDFTDAELGDDNAAVAISPPATSSAAGARSVERPVVTELGAREQTYTDRFGEVHRGSASFIASLRALEEQEAA